MAMVEGPVDSKRARERALDSKRAREPAPDPERFEELSRVLVPLVLGGRIELARPFGPRLALAIGKGRALVDPAIRTRVELVRVRRARMIAPIDTLPELDADDWALVCAYNDLLQSTNHELAGRFSRSRHERLLASVVELCEHVAPPSDVRQALSRHATFSRALEIFRKDTAVSWWTGKASFRGQTPPMRLLRWREVRRVRVEEQRVSLAEMCIGIDTITTEAFLGALAGWISRSPLTDLASATRREPLFSWTKSTLSLIGSQPGRVLATRVLAREPPDLAALALSRAASEIPKADAEARALAQSFAAEVAEAAKVHAAQAG